MYLETFTVAIGAAATQLSTLLADPKLFLAAKVRVQTAPAATGNVFVGGSTVTNAGANAYASGVLAPPSGTVPGGIFNLEDQSNRDSIDTRNIWIHGSHTTDNALVTVWRN